MKLELRHHRTCPHCKGSLERRRREWLCLRCLLIFHGDTYEPIQQSLEGDTFFDLFFPLA